MLGSLDASGSKEEKETLRSLSPLTAVLDEVVRPDAKEREKLLSDAEVLTVRLPFTPNQLDDAFPSVEIKEEGIVGRNLFKFVLELINKTRFSGFVEFDDSYRLMILWANAPADDPQDQDGTFRDHLVKILHSHLNEFTTIVRQKPVVSKIKTGAALYFPTPISIREVHKGTEEIVKLINKINASLADMEQHTGDNSVFNRSIDNDELEDLNVEEVA
jgi:hypothetical protein